MQLAPIGVYIVEADHFDRATAWEDDAANCVFSVWVLAHFSRGPSYDKTPIGGDRSGLEQARQALAKSVNKACRWAIRGLHGRALSSSPRPR
jgi:hypothetical protein